MITHPYLLPAPRRESPIDRAMTYVADDGLDLDRFVEDGGRSLSAEDLQGLRAGLADLREKIETIRPELPRLARQLEFLADFFQRAVERQRALLSDRLIHETAFALLYAARDMELIPDNLPGVGFTDDAAVVEIVLERHAETFFQECRLRQLPWVEICPRLPYRS